MAPKPAGETWAKDVVGINAGQFYTECGKLKSGKSSRFYIGRTDGISEDTARVDSTQG
jgi:hypothetical protein